MDPGASSFVKWENFLRRPLAVWGFKINLSYWLSLGTAKIPTLSSNRIPSFLKTLQAPFESHFSASFKTTHLDCSELSPGAYYPKDVRVAGLWQDRWKHLEPPCHAKRGPDQIVGYAPIYCEMQQRVSLHKLKADIYHWNPELLTLGKKGQYYCQDGYHKLLGQKPHCHDPPDGTEVYYRDQNLWKENALIHQGPHPDVRAVP